MFALKLKLFVALLGAGVSAVRSGRHTAYGPTADGRYAIIGEGYVPTRDCTVTAVGMRADLSDDGRWLTFRDEGGEEEGICEVGVRPTMTVTGETIRREPAVLK